MSDLPHPLWPETPETRSRSQGRTGDGLQRRKHGGWHNAGDPGENSLDPGSVGITPPSGYINDVGLRWRRRLGGGIEIQIAVDGGSNGDVVYVLPDNALVSG